MKKSFKDLLEELEESKLYEAGKEDPPEENAGNDDVDSDDDDDDEEKDEPSAKELPDMDKKNQYTADDLKELIAYVQDLLKKEHEEDGDDDDDDDDKKKDDKFEDIGLDLISEYADLMSNSLINQIVNDLKSVFEINDSMLESVISEGGAFFNKSQSGPAAQAAKLVMRQYYRKNKAKILKRNKKWRNSEIGKRMIALHKKIMSGMGMKGKHVVHPHFA